MKKIFISHIDSESKIANLLKSTLECAFANKIEVFVSSHHKSIPWGDEWFHTIMDNLRNLDLIIILCGPTSERHPWITFEAGCGAGQSKPVIPLCHSGMTPGKLKFPLKGLQGAELDTQRMQFLIERIANEIGCAVPQFDENVFNKELQNLEEENKHGIIHEDVKKIYGLLESDLTWLKLSIISSSSEITSSINLQTYLDNISTYEIEFKHIHVIFQISLCKAFLDQKNYDVLYNYIDRMLDDIKFIVTSGMYQVPDSIYKLFEEYLAHSSDPQLWYYQINMVAQNEKLRKEVAEMIKQGTKPPYDSPIDYVLKYFDTLQFLKDWIVKIEAIFRQYHSKEDSDTAT
ncbi:MAG: toll/interleukin-1 receptor domain-containing protein [Spirochaetaceae bacterium]|nr:toll/interleukin-1 receptor domain-containing protein [Spirochaetaceae bacterium]